MSPLGSISDDSVICIPTGKPTVTGASIHTNVLIKNPLPARGIVSSNPLRVERLLQNASKDGVLTRINRSHTDSGWGIKIATAVYKNDTEIFIAVIPLGSTGAGFCFFEMFAAGAQAIVRYGANDATATMREFCIVDTVDNLVGLPYAAGNKQASRSDTFHASDDLVALLQFKASSEGLPIKQMICHNVEDYHAYNFSELFEQGNTIRSQIEERRNSAPKINSTSATQECCWDMETAALFLRAKQFGRHAATVLLPTKSSLEIETTHFGVIFEALLDFAVQSAGEALPDTNNSYGAYAGGNGLTRSARKHSTNDLIGIEEPLFSVEDIEIGNGLFADDEDV